MKIHSAEFIKSATQLEHYPTDFLPEILFAGRSNVGKSSFINSLLNRKNIAHTSGKPGKTQTLNFYKVNDAFYFVDVPGYGYAKVSKKAREEFAEMIAEEFRIPVGELSHKSMADGGLREAEPIEFPLGNCHRPRSPKERLGQS